jgi:glycine betaine/choline ABC-type transport system substrate-binding protein
MRRAPALLAAAALAAAACSSKPRPFLVGAKANSTDSVLAAEAAAALLEEGGIPAEVKRDMSAGAIFSELKVGHIDAYAEQTGVALTSVLREPPPEPESQDRQPAALVARLREEFAKRWGIVWLDPLGYHGAYRLAMRDGHARALGVGTLSQLAATGRGLRCGFSADFAERPDGYRAVHHAYDAELCSSVTHQPTAAMYQALVDAHVDVVSARAVDGRLERLGLRALDDDRGVLPSYETSLLLSPEVARRFPAAEARLKPLAARVDDEAMAQMAARVELDKQSPRDAARAFLRARGLLH